MNFSRVFEILNDHRRSEYKVEYKDEDGEWRELYEDQPIRLLYEKEIRIVKK